VRRGDSVMKFGTHFAQFELLKAAGRVVVGVASADFDPAAGGWWATDSAAGFGLHTGGGALRTRSELVDWQGQQSAAESDTIGLLLDCDQGTLVAFKPGSGSVRWWGLGNCRC
jgi:hypothetical protein